MLFRITHIQNEMVSKSEEGNNHHRIQQGLTPGGRRFVDDTPCHRGNGIADNKGQREIVK